MTIIIISISLFIIFLDISKKINITQGKINLLILLLIPFSANALSYVLSDFFLSLTYLIITFYYLVRLFFLPSRKINFKYKRLMILNDGRFILNSSLYLLLGHLLVSGTLYIVYDYFSTMSMLFTLILYIALLYNGLFRIIFTSKKLSIFAKAFSYFTIWIPIFNIFLIAYLSKNIKSEVFHNLDKIDKNNWRKKSLICETKYPILLLHGVGFRDIKYFNYWGNIPKELISNGASIYYGHQQGFATIEDNGIEIKSKILEIIEKEKCDKVNIIAHSKGGLDARYTISTLNMDSYVASLTTISTPHHGTDLIKILFKFPKSLLDFLSKRYNGYFRLLGDSNPNFLETLGQFLPSASNEFNKDNPDSDMVYYQSYGARLSSIFSDYILGIPYCILYFLEGPNDGLVSIKSAMWGDFKGVMKSKSMRGISHGDQIDLRRQQYNGFDVLEFYVNLVSNLKNNGF